MHVKATPKGLAKRVAAGAKYLDEVQPDWYTKVNPSQLDMMDGRQCVAGQVFGNYNSLPFRKEYKLRYRVAESNGRYMWGDWLRHRSDKMAVRFGFAVNYADEYGLRALWIDAIMRRKEHDALESDMQPVGGNL